MMYTDGRQSMRIIEYEDKYRDDMIFMVLEAKNALGFVPRLNNDLLDVKANYLDKGAAFYLAIDDNDRVIGCVGYESLDMRTAKLHRFYVKASLKRQGIGSALLEKIESSIAQAGYREIVAHLGGPEYVESKAFYPAKGYLEYQPNWMRKLI